jgi:predicted metal-dependent enzyme (double-stranded beta helix superfamily)
MSSQVQLEIASFCKRCSDRLYGITDDESCVERFRDELPSLLCNKPLFAEILHNVVEGGTYPDLGRSTMFDNELLLHADSSHLFTLRMFLWGPGECTVIHDHNSWGVIGPVSGVLGVFNYKREDNGSREGYAHLIETEELRCLPGETTFTLPLNQGIHKIGNPTQESMVSLSVYGKPLARGYINGFDIDNDRIYKIFAPKSKKKILAFQALAGLK